MYYIYIYIAYMFMLYTVKDLSMYVIGLSSNNSQLDSAQRVDVLCSGPYSIVTGLLVIYVPCCIQK